ncbi:MAG: response regulator transcription factor [Vicinamibacterales bacterium]
MVARASRDGDGPPTQRADRAVFPVGSPDVLERIHAMWDELAAFEAAEIDAALVHLLGAVAALVDAQNAYWLGVVRLSEDDRDPLLGWRPRAIRYLQPLPIDETYARQKIRSMGRGEYDESTAAHVRLSGRYRARRLADLVSPAWFAAETYTTGYIGRDIHDALMVGAPVNTMAEAYYGFHRKRPDDPFTTTQRDTALYAMRGLTWFHRQVLLGHGLLVARAPLSPMERRVLALLLTDRSEKLIAAELGVAPATAHTYVRDVLRKFGVSGRSGLTALWLGRQP